MTSFKTCNFCILEQIKNEALGTSKVITTREADFNAIKEFNNGSPGIDILVNGEFMAWFMKLPERCEC